MRLALFLLLLTTSAAWAQMEYSATATEAVLRYEAGGSSACSVAASAGEDFGELVAAVDPEVVPGGASDEGFEARRRGGRREFVLGRSAVAMVRGRQIPLWLEPDTTYYVRIRCEGQPVVAGTIHTEPAAASSSGACTYVLNAGGGSFPSLGGAFGLVVTAPPGCAWSAAAQAAWVRISSGTGRTGSGSVTLAIDANLGSSRATDVTIAGHTFRLTQESGPQQPPPACTVSLGSAGSWFPAAGAPASIPVTAPAGCLWQATTDVGWISFRSAPGWYGSGTINAQIAPGTGTVRTGRILAGGQTFTVNQVAADVAACTYTLSHYLSYVPSGGGAYSIAVMTESRCAWNVTPRVPWIRVLGTPQGAGAGAVTLVVEANQGVDRSGLVTIGDVDFRVNQVAVSTEAPANCGAALPPRASWYPSDRDSSYTVQVNAPPGCFWRAVPDAAWIRIQAPDYGYGPGSLGFTVTRNDGPSRSGVITAGGETFQISQPAMVCSYTPSYRSTWLPAGAGDYSLTVTVPVGCVLDPVPSASWIRITEIAREATQTRIRYGVDPNPNSPRMATIPVGSGLVEVRQVGGFVSPSNCVITPAALGSWFPQTGGTYDLWVSASAADCGWSAVPNGGWIRVLNGASGFGSRMVRYAVDANDGPARAGRITTGQSAFALNQIAGACAISLGYSSSWFPAAGGTFSLPVTAAAGCGWRAVSGASWVRVYAGASGSGIGAVSYTMEANTGVARSTSITVAGVTLTIHQTGR